MALTDFKSEDLKSRVEALKGGKIIVSYKQYTPTFTNNSYVSPYTTFTQNNVIPQDDINTLGVPIYGTVLAAGAPISPISIGKTGEQYTYMACGNSREDKVVRITFIKIQ